MDKREYYVGLDIGTGSLGWAVTDTDYNVLKINRKPAWGAVLFDTSEGAEARRLNRCARRRIRREKERLNLLRELFEEEIQKVDSGFFQRLSESRYVYEDKRTADGLRPELPYSLFADADYTDADYHKEFPTIYHLRKALIEEEREFDIRLVYLAIAHIIKHRGHFLANMGSEDTSLDFTEIFKDLINVWNDIAADDGQTIKLSEKQINDIGEILKNKSYTKTLKKQSVIQVLKDSSKEFKELIGLVTGGKVSLSKLFNVKEFDSLEENKICFDEASYEEKEEYYAENLSDYFDVIVKAKAVYDWMVLLNVLKGNNSGLISAAKVEDYDKHKKDLRILKDAVKYDGAGSAEDRKKLYKCIFGIPDKNVDNYTTYIGSALINGKKRIVDNKKCSRSDFYKFLNKQVIPFLNDGERKKYITEQILLDSFLPKSKVNENSVIPYQLHLKELQKILSNAERYLPFLKEKDASGLTVSEKIISLLKFKIPYYVGPLNTSHERAWAIRTGTGKVTPWNFDEKVDVEGSAKEFIERMKSRCTYLKHEKVLPKSSLLYEKYMVLNEINNLRIKSEPISVELKQRIYSNLFERKQKVTVKKIVDYLKREEVGYSDITKDDISGIDIEIKSSLKSYHAFKRQFTGVELSEAAKEDIINDMTLFGAEPKLLMKRLKSKYPDYEKQLSALVKSLKCSDWGRLSYKFLSGIAVDVEGQGKVRTIIYQLWNTNLNMMQILNDSRFNYGKLIEEENGELEKKDIRYEIVENLYVSPAVKRQIWKALQVLEEIMHAMGHPPKRVFVEMAREPVESKRSVTRKDALMELYKSIKVDADLFGDLKKEDNDRLRSDKLYLYYTQLGHCAYTGDRIDRGELFDDNKYDIDHIYPQSATADDSLDNRVLVYKPFNSGVKKDIYPISAETQNKMRNTWFMWKQKGLISEEKYNRLIRTTGLTADELTGFVNRQLVETRQSTKELMNLLKEILPPETELVYSKAKNVSMFRQQFNIVKIRELNDLHHAKDAYLNIVVGNVFHLKFTKDIRKYFDKNGTYRSYNLVRMYDYDVNYMSETAWKKGSSGTISVVKRTLDSDKILVSRQVYARRGQLFDVQPLKKGKGQVPLKSGAGNERLADIQKYGGYNGAAITYFALIEGRDKKGKPARYIVGVPLYLSEKIENDESYAVSFFENESDLKDVCIIKNKIYIQTLMVCEGFKMRIAGKSGPRIVFNNANQLSMKYKYYKPLKEVVKFIKDGKEKKDALINEKSGITHEIMLDIYDEFMFKLNSTVYHEFLGSYVKKLGNGRDEFVKLSLENQAIQVYEILKLFQCTPEMPDLHMIGGSKTQGRINIGVNITDRKNFAIIHQSVTGLYEQIERIGI